MEGKSTCKPIVIDEPIPTPKYVGVFYQKIVFVDGTIRYEYNEGSGITNLVTRGKCWDIDCLKPAIGKCKCGTLFCEKCIRPSQECPMCTMGKSDKTYERLRRAMKERADIFGEPSDDDEDDTTTIESETSSDECEYIDMQIYSS
jgi:hypothetical protein